MGGTPGLGAMPSAPCWENLSLQPGQQGVEQSWMPLVAQGCQCSPVSYHGWGEGSLWDPRGPSWSQKVLGGRSWGLWEVMGVLEAL